MPIPPPPNNTPIADGRLGLRVTREWLAWFTNFWQNTAGGGLAPANATYVVASADPTLTNERVATSSTSITVDTATPGVMSWLRAALTGDVTASANSNATTIANDAVTFAKMQNISTQRLIGRNTAGSGDPEEVTISQALDWLP